MGKHILFIAANARSLIANRGDLIGAMQQSGHHVSAAVPSEDYLDGVDELGISVHRFALGRTAINPLMDIRTIMWLTRLARRIKPDIVYAYGVKPVIYGTLAARLAAVPRRYAMITGLGTIFIRPNRGWNRPLHALVASMYRLAMVNSHKVFFQNPDDMRDFVDLGILRDRSKAVRTMGSGVNLQQFAKARAPKGPPVFLFIGRLLRDKGIAEFCVAARQVRTLWPEARFAAVGPHDPNLPHSVSKADLDSWKAEGIVEFRGSMADVRWVLAEASVFVLPSYREGTPRSTLEAMATGRPIITTDVPGCRETVHDGENGFLVPVRDEAALAQAMLRFRDAPDLIVRMGEKSHQRAIFDYDVRKVNQRILEAMEIE